MNKIFKVSNRDKFRELLEYLEEEGCYWRGSDKLPTEFKNHNIADKGIYIIVEDGEITHTTLNIFKVLRNKYENFEYEEL